MGELSPSLLPSRYRLVRPLGRGGQGSVVLVEDLARGGTPRALKAVAGDSSSAAATGDLAAEFLTLSRLAHPALARVRDFGRLAGGDGVYFTEDFVPGEPLLEWAAAFEGDEPDARLAFERALLELAAQALAVLQYLAKRGLHHGDVKPQNILVEPAPASGGPLWSLRLVDFGAARIADVLGRGPRAGTPAYLPPAAPGGGAPLDPDLYGLGMSLFHALAGHLPFPIGEPGALVAWHARRVPAVPSEWRPEVSPRLDRLVRRLTSHATPPERFPDARTASAWLHGRTSASLAPPRTVSSLYGREPFIDEVVESWRRPRGAAPPATLLQGPAGSGKTSLLEALRARAQAAGAHTVYLAGPEDTDGLTELLALAGPQPGERLGEPAAGRGAAELALGLLARLDGPFVLLVDRAEADAWPDLVAEVLRQGLGTGGRAPDTLRAVLASSSPEVPSLLAGLPQESYRTAGIEPLDAAALRSMASDFFGIEAPPPALLGVLEEASGGWPLEARRALERIAAAGARVDFLGELRLPRDLDRRLAGDGDSAPAPAGELLPVPLDRMLALLGIAGTALTPAEAAWLHPEFTAETWERGLDALYWRGIAVRRGADRPWRTGLGTRRRSQETGGLSDADALEVSRAVARRMRDASGNRPTPSGVPRSAEASIAVARHALAAGDGPLACRMVLRARRLCIRASRLEEAFAVLTEVAARETPDAGRWHRMVELRAAELALPLGRADAGLAVLEGARGRGGQPPRWFLPALRRRRARLLEHLGRPLDAARELESLGRETGARWAASREAETAARLAWLLFQGGEPERARGRLEEAARLARALPGGLPAAEVVAALSILAGTEIAHGDPERAVPWLEGAIARARQGARDDLLCEPLERLAILHGNAGRFGEAQALFREVEEAAARLGDPLARLKALYNRALLALRGEELDVAEALFRDAARVSEAMGRHPFAATVWLGLAGLLRERAGTLEALRLYLRVVSPRSPARANDRILAHMNRGEIYQDLGRLARSRDEREKALRLARGLDSRFLLAVALRNLGAVELAFGRAEAARGALEEAIALGEATAGARWTGGARYHLAFLERDPGARLAAWRRARAECRALGDRPYEVAATLAVLDLLLSAGRRGFARKRLGKLLDGSRPLAPRLAVLARALAVRAAAEWPGNFVAFRGVLETAEAEGLWWQVFLALGQGLGDPAIKAPEREEVRTWREAVGLRLARGVSAAEREAFRAFWFGERDPSAAATPRRRAPRRERAAPEAWHAPLVEWSGTARPEGFEAAATAALSRLAEALGADRVWIVDPSGTGAPLSSSPGAGDGSDGSDGSLHRAGALLESARERGELQADAAGLAAPIASGRPRALVATAPRSGWPRSGDRRRSLLAREAAAVLGLALALAERTGELAREQTLSRTARAETRRLSRALAREKELLDTALLSGRTGPAQTDSSAAGAAGEPVAASRAMRDIMSHLPSLAAGELPVLLLGESGVGKDYLARWIHHLSPRRARPFLAEICSLPESLLEAELFGFVRGAFTGAEADHPGLLQRVHGGTLYLDEIAELALPVQKGLLRVLEEKRVRPVGGDTEVALDFRLISSSRKTSTRELVAGGLREDLYYRLRGEAIYIPPLRERPEDIGALVERFLALHAAAHRRPRAYLHPASLEKLLAHPWPGNVRELHNELDRALLENPSELAPDLLLRERTDRPPEPPRRVDRGLREARDVFERQCIVHALEAHRGNASRAAAALGVTRRHLGKLLDKHRLDLRRFKP